MLQTLNGGKDDRRLARDENNLNGTSHLDCCPLHTSSKGTKKYRSRAVYLTLNASVQLHTVVTRK